MSTATVSQYEVGSTYHLPPTMLLLERNIREAKPDQDLIDSVADLGVLEPIGAVVTADGALLVRSGHRRTLAAIKAKTATVPVYVRGTDDLDPGAEALRVIQQYDENTHRNGLTTAENVGVVDQLVMFGIPAEEISKRHRISKEQVDAAVRVAGSAMATKAAARWENLSLDEAAAIAEFENDKDAVKRLVTAANEGDFEHTVQRMRDDRDRDLKHTACLERITELGVTAFKSAPSWDDKACRGDRLLDAKTDKKVTPAAHAKCPGRIAWPAWDHNAKDFAPEYGCSDPKKYGHRDSWKNSGSSSKPNLADLSEEQREAAKAERKLVIENNKAWASAETVRRSWVGASIAQLNTAPKGTAAFITFGISNDRTQFNYAAGSNELVSNWLGRDALADLHKLSEARALVFALVEMLAVYEANLNKDSWRRNGTTNECGRYLRFLESAGYPLSDVEKYAISKKTA